MDRLLKLIVVGLFGSALLLGCGDDGGGEEDDTSMTDTGAGGMCGSSDTTAAMVDGFGDAFTGCIVMSVGASDPEATLGTCVDTETTLTSSCIDCVAPVATCTNTNCSTECSGSNDDDTCFLCLCSNGCFSAVSSCLGFDPCMNDDDGGV